MAKQRFQFNAWSVTQLALGPLSAVINQFLKFLPVAWAFEDVQKGSATLASFIAVLIGLILVRSNAPLQRSSVAIASAALTFVLVLVYLGFLEWISPNPHRFPLAEFMLAPLLVGLYALPFFSLSLGLAVLGWASVISAS